MSTRPSTTPGRRRVTAADVARSLGISRATVGFVLNNTQGQTISAATRERVLAEAERLGYRPNEAARALASGQSKLVLVVLPDWPLDHSMRRHLDEAEHVLDDAGYSMVTMALHQGRRARPLWEVLAPDAVVSLGPLGAETLASMRSAGVQRIFPSEAVEPVGVLPYAQGPRLQVEHVWANGRRAVAFVGSADRRVAGLVAERRRLATQTLEGLSGSGFVADLDVDADSADAVAAELVAARVDAVVAYNDDVAALVAGALLRAGESIPEDVAIVGHDNSPLAALFHPALSSVQVDTGELGRYLALVALGLIEGSAPVPLPPTTEATLIRRASS